MIAGGDAGTSQASEQNRVSTVIERYLRGMDNEYSRLRLYPEQIVRKHFQLTGTCCDGAAELSNQGRLYPNQTDGTDSLRKTRFDLFEVKSSSIDRKHTRQTPNSTVPDIGQAQIEKTANVLNERIIMRQGICFVGTDMKLRGAEICDHALYRKVGLKKRKEPERIRNSCALKVYKYDESYEIQW